MVSVFGDFGAEFPLVMHLAFVQEHKGSCAFLRCFCSKLRRPREFVAKVEEFSITLPPSASGSGGPSTQSAKPLAPDLQAF